jgi:hypothetical protein
MNGVKIMKVLSAQVTGTKHQEASKKESAKDIITPY